MSLKETWNRVMTAWRNWADEARFQREIERSAMYWHRAGHPSPYERAAHEMALRLKIEQFRTWANRRYLEDPSLLLDQLKSEWLDLEIKPMMKIDICREDGKLLMDAIAAMPHSEVFFGEAARVMEERTQAVLRECRANEKSWALLRKGAFEG